MIAALLLAAAVPALAAAPAVSTGTVSQLTERFLETTSAENKTAILGEIARTAPRTGQDIANLLDLFTRYSDSYTRRSIMDSLAKIGPGNPQLEPLFLTYLKQPEPDAQLFGVNGAFRLRSRPALPLIREIAERKMTAKEGSETGMLSERNSWWTQYEALSALSQWEPEKSYALVDAKAYESPKVAALLGRYYWKKTLPRLRGWSESGKLGDAERASQAVAAPIEMADARDTRVEMISLLKDPKVDSDIRHQLALKVGLSSTEDEIEELIKAHDAAPSDAEKLYWATAVFITRSRKAVPLLVRYAHKTGEPVQAKGAADQLKDMLGPAEAAALLDPEKKK